MSTDLAKIPSDLRKALQAELAPGERVLYAGRPDWRAEMGSLVLLFGIGVFWSAISFLFFGLSGGGLLGLNEIKSNGAPAGFGLTLFMFLFSSLFVAVGLFLLAAPFLGIRKSRHTVHVVTDSRVLSVFTGRDRGTESYPFSKINFIKRTDRKDGTGSLSIGYGIERDSDGDPKPLTLDWSGIPNAKRAETLIREHAKGAW
jgi:hypothetical protein